MAGLLLPAASGELLVESTKPEYESGETISVRIELTGSTRANAKLLNAWGSFPEDPEKHLSGLLPSLDAEYEGNYYFNWTVAEYGTYHGNINITVTAYKSSNRNDSNIIAQDVIVVEIVEPAGRAGIALPFDLMQAGVVMLALVAFVGGVFFVYRFFSDRDVVIPGDLSGLTGLSGLGGPGGLSPLGGKTEERKKPAKTAAKSPARKARSKSRKGRESGREKRKPPGRRKPVTKSKARAKPRRPARPKARPPPARPPPRPPGVTPSTPASKAPSSKGPPKPKAPPRPKGPPKPKAPTFHCPTDGNELQHWPGSGYETDYYCSKCELYVKPKEQAGGGGSSDSPSTEAKEVTCPGCHTVHDISDPTVKRITCTCGRRIRVNTG